MLLTPGTRYGRRIGMIALLLCATAVGGHPLLSHTEPWVVQANGMTQVASPSGRYQAKIGDADDPFLVLAPVRINADREGFIQLELELSARAAIQVFFAEQAGAFSEVRSFRLTRSLERGRAVYEIDLRKLTEWKGTVRSLRLDFENIKAGEQVTLFGLSASEEPAQDAGVIRMTPRLPPQPGERVRTERLAAYHKTVVLTDEAVPNSAVFTYLMQRFTYTDRNFLAKIMPVLHGGDGPSTCDAAEDVRVEDTPGGVTAAFTLAERRVRTDIVPLFVGRGADRPEGAVLYSIQVDAPTPDGPAGTDDRKLSLVVNADPTGLRQCEFVPIAGGATVSDGTSHYTAGEDRIPVAVRCPGGTLIVEKDGTLRADFPGNGGRIVIAFGSTRERAAELAGRDPQAAIDEVAAYYRGLMSANRIETPEPAINEAFTHALRTLEYTWIEPIGWLECIHHWFSLWHMQATAGAEWIGQADRSRACTLAHAGQLTAEGAVPQFSPSGQVHRDFGGSNQYWAWQARHYWQFTADRAFAEQAAPALDKVLAQTSKEYDKDGNLLLAWGLQIGNQEDYVATPYDGTTPSVEGINMLLTRAELARGLGDAATAERFEQRAARARALLRERLWMSDLGRYAYFVDPHGNRRLDGQYHTLAYPVIWGLADPLDSYTMLRHLHDRLTGEGGEVYCSNNFPNHVGGTWGMQAGAAQQPWAAWALSAAGHLERTYRPLKAVADWVMNADHRGSWPEVATEPTPAYFSPPAGLFVASTVEALFGLKVDVPAGVLNVSPSFPSHWPKASLHLAAFIAVYEREGNHIGYTVRSERPLERRLAWHLPPCRVTAFRIDGRPAEFELQPGVNTVRLLARSPAAKSTTFTIDFEPADVSIVAPASVSTGETIRIEVAGAEIEQIDDRNAILGTYTQDPATPHPPSRSPLPGPGSPLPATPSPTPAPRSPSLFEATVRGNLLQATSGFGRLGQLTFARRSFFVLCSTVRGVRFWHPVDLTVLPPFEMAPVVEPDREGAVHVASDGISLVCQLLLRNNTGRPLSGAGSLILAGGEYPLHIDVPARSERQLSVHVPANMAGLLALGDNRATLVLPGNAGTLDTTLSAIEPFTKIETLGTAAQASLLQIPLDESAMIPDTQWTALRVCPAYPHMPWAGSRPPLEALAGQKTIACPDLPHVAFALPDRKFIPVSFKAGRPICTLDLKGRLCRKLFLLVVPFLDNHDMFSTVGRVTVRSPEEIVHVQTLRFPGDLDWWSPPAIVGEFATIGREPRDRHGLLPMLAPEAADWRQGRPPVFPQPRFWSDSRHVVTGSSVMNVIEVDLDRFVEVTSLMFESIGVDPSFGIVSVTAMTADGQSLLEGTAWSPPVACRQPRMLFDFAQQPETGAWELEGEAFSVADFPSLFSTRTLNSLAKAGETATGRATSPEFQLNPTDTTLLVRYHGGRSKADSGPGLMAIDLLDARDGTRLHRLALAADHNLRWERIDVRRWAGRTVRLQLTDENTDTSFAWLGLAGVKVISE